MKVIGIKMKVISIKTISTNFSDLFVLPGKNS